MFLMPSSVPPLATHIDPVVAPWTTMALEARGDADKHPSLVFELIPVTFLEGAVVTLTLCLCFVGFVVALGRKLNNNDDDDDDGLRGWWSTPLLGPWLAIPAGIALAVPTTRPWMVWVGFGVIAAWWTGCLVLSWWESRDRRAADLGG